MGILYLHHFRLVPGKINGIDAHLLRLRPGIIFKFHIYRVVYAVIDPLCANIHRIHAGILVTCFYMERIP
jgi:hypothetical protein